MISLCHPIRRYPVAFWQVTWPARTEDARAAQLLWNHYPAVFGRARLRRLGYPGIRQTRTIGGEYMLTVEDVLAGRRFPDAIARVAWPIELHDSTASYRWQPFPDGHTYTIPYRAVLSPELANLLAIGRCIDAEPAALSSARVMGPCIAMGVAAAHAADLASVDQFSFRNTALPRLQERLQRNLS
ncbi:MAG: FAD-dependent oxidoreductase [Thermomicrobium sp.]|uniref:FAD-dependent oxidoreductase n=1 Tax=Thermomicrobium sp. TaxID=1969469 RepID=UPI001B11D848|nr:FAD-dependent oxidoreductase [Thermomicrobium sp.]MBO9352150.1 FAD-dependent oxidoreductase [Thermomicrobium sp.]